MGRIFRDLLEAQWSKGNFVCVGLDSDHTKIPQSARRGFIAPTIRSFNYSIIEATKDLVCAYKPNIAFYEAYGGEGWDALVATVQTINRIAPDVPVILDAKRGDIGSTNNGYVSAFFDYLGVDAVTINPYLGSQALQPFLDQKDKGIFVLCKTSNPGAEEIQDLLVGSSELNPVYLAVAHLVASKWNTNSNCGVVVGATYPTDLQQVRTYVGDIPILIPGVGAQGGNLEMAVLEGRNSKHQGIIVNSSRGIIFASDGPDFAEAARRETLKLKESINLIIE